MSDTYIGWDGNPYPAPPPEGWYLASDGRWWAPDTGPGPAVAPQQTGSAGRLFPPPDDELGPRSDSVATAIAANTADYPAPAPRPPADYADTGSSSVAGGAGPALHDTMAMPSFAPQGAPTSRTANPYGPPSHGAGQRPPPGPELPGVPPGGGAGGAGTNKIVVAAVGALVALALGTGVFLLLSRDGDETATGGTTETTAAAPGTDNTAETTIETATTNPTDTTVDGATASTDTVPPVDTTLVGEGVELVASFRGLLLDNGLTSDQLTDTQIQTFATSFCIFAQNSETPEQFDEFRRQAIAETTSSLGPESLGLVIDAAVITFCPDDAARLGLSL